MKITPSNHDTPTLGSDGCLREIGPTKRRVTARRQQRFLAALAETGNITLAARAAAVPRSSIYEHRAADAAFAKAWEEAEQIAADRLEAEAWRRGVDGVPEPLVSAGRLVGDADGKPIFVQRYSDTLLLALLRAHKPDKFRDRTSVELDVSDRLAERLESARQRLLTKEGPVLVIDNDPDRADSQ
jgi:hypothetical protein